MLVSNDNWYYNLFGVICRGCGDEFHVEGNSLLDSCWDRTMPFEEKEKMKTGKGRQLLFNDWTLTEKETEK